MRNERCLELGEFLVKLFNLLFIAHSKQSSCNNTSHSKRKSDGMIRHITYKSFSSIFLDEKRTFVGLFEKYINRRLESLEFVFQAVQVVDRVKGFPHRLHKLDDLLVQSNLISYDLVVPSSRR